MLFVATFSMLLLVAAVHAEDAQCPERDGDKAVFLPNDDCTKFSLCSNGVAHLFNCPDGLEFNPTLNVCDWPENAGCEGSSESGDDTSEDSSDSDSDEDEGDDDEEDDEEGEEDDEAVKKTLVEEKPKVIQQ